MTGYASKRAMNIDLEAWVPNTLNNITGGIHPGQIMAYAAGRRTGKSMLIQHYMMTSKSASKSAPKYKFSRDWYIAEISTGDYDQVRAWCREQFGPEDKFPNAWSRWQHRYEHQIFFRDERDYHWFVLRWGA